ncbi:MAG: hypothetical protein JOZ54_01400 [Acidobacteria bacterium]|nr:hypothetical protein [Acidobacteriota bacterium]
MPRVTLGYDPRFPYRNELARPVIGLEAEFQPFVDGREVVPEELWKTPAAFIDQTLLRRTQKSSQLPTGGAVYFDGGVIEVVTPVIELAPHSTARVVRSLWEQIGFVRDQLDRWEKRTGKRVTLRAFSCHTNISFELGRDERSSDRTIQKLAVLLAHLLPAPVIVAGANRRSTGIGVRPRRDRIEITLDFTPDPGLMAATTALIVGIARDVIQWPSYRLEELDTRQIPQLAELQPGKHATRKGWVAKDYHFPRSPFTSDIDAPDWKLRGGGTASLREIGLAIANVFRSSIHALADPFSERLLFSVLEGDTPSLLDLADRPAAYDDVGRATRWGSVLPDLENFAGLMQGPDELREHIEARDARRVEHEAEPPKMRRRRDLEEQLAPPWSGERTERRKRPRRYADRRSQGAAGSPAPLTRSDYEQVFLNLGSRRNLRIGEDVFTPVAVRGWYHAVLRAPNGEERLLSIDQILQLGDAWT